MKTLTLIAILAALATTSAQALDSTAWNAAQTQFAQAQSGQSGSAAKAASLFGTLAEEDAQNPLPRVYLGSAETMQARDALAPWTKIRHCEQGLADIDRALALLRPEHSQARPGQVPVSATVKLTAASTFVALPGFFNRGQAGRKLLGELIAEPGFAALPTAFRAQTLDAAARSADNPAVRRDYLSRLAELDSPLAAKARTAIAEARK